MLPQDLEGIVEHLVGMRSRFVGHARGLGLGTQDAEDCAQMTIIAGSANAPDFATRSRPEMESWLFQRNSWNVTAIRRKNERRPEDLLDGILKTEPGDPLGATPSAIVAGMELRERFQRAFLKLPESSQRRMWRRYVDEAPPAELIVEEGLATALEVAQAQWFKKVEQRDDPVIGRVTASKTRVSQMLIKDRDRLASLLLEEGIRPSDISSIGRAP